MPINTPQNKQNNGGSRPQILCPHCQLTNLKIRSSEQDHLLLKKLWLQCPNLFCGFSCGGNIEITHTISPSASPNPEIVLLTLAEIMQRKACNDDFSETE